MATVTALRVPFRDYPLAVTEYTPVRPDSTPDRVLLINSATGVPQGYYRPFSQFMAESGYRVYTYDYGGMNLSRAGRAQDARVTMLQWGTHDLASLLNWVAERHPRASIHCIGHSVGAQLVGLAENNYRIERLLSVAGQAGYWRLWRGANRVKAWMTFFVLVPLLTELYGYLPKFVLGSCELPYGVARQWARWCRHPDFIVDLEGKPIRQYFRAYRGKILFYSFADDRLFAPRRAVDELSRYYCNARIERRHIGRDESGNEAVGHFGFFRPQFKSSLWREALTWLAR